MGEQMKKTFFNILILALVIFSLSTCTDPIFYMVSREVKQLEPKIAGSPSNFVELNGAMYVASGRNIWQYENRSWNCHGQDRWIAQLAATTTRLYALCDDGSVIRSTSGTGTGISTEAIFAVGNVLFYNNGNSISYLDDSDNTGQIVANVSMLNGAASDVTYFYLSTKSNGIYYIDKGLSGTATQIADSQKGFMGIISLEDNTVVAITRDGELYKIEIGGVSEIVTYDSLANGALALWSNSDSGLNDKLLLVGRQDTLTYSTQSGYTYGYVELALDASGGLIPDSSFNEPGTASPSTVSDNESYISSIGKNPVNHIFQASDGILFASTQKNGVWSYKERDGEKQWNAETD